MQIRSQNYKIKGMRQDESYSAFNPEYSWSNKNIRLTARDGNDLLSITNERGNLSIGINEYYRDDNPTKYSYISTFHGYSNTMELATYSYDSTFSNYSNTLINI